MAGSVGYRRIAIVVEISGVGGFREVGGRIHSFMMAWTSFSGALSVFKSSFNEWCEHRILLR